MKEYRSFEEIDRDLSILKLQNEIDKEELKLSIKRVKREISPGELLGNLSSAIKEKALETKAIVEGATKGFIENFKEKNNQRIGAGGPKVKLVETEIDDPYRTNIVVDKVVVEPVQDRPVGDKPL